MHWSRRRYALFSLVSTLFQEAVLVAVVLFLLPRFGIDIPIWLLIVFMVALAVYSYITFRLSEEVIGQRPMVGAEELIGTRGVTMTALSPEGYVRGGGERWRACSCAGEMDKQSEVTVKDVKGLTLFVMSEGTNADSHQQYESEGR